MTKGKNIFYILIFILLMGPLSTLHGNNAIALLIDPSNPDRNKVKLFQEKYMEMNESDIGYGSFGPKTTAKWKEIIYNDQTYKNLYEEAEILKENKKLKDSNMLLCNIIDAPHTPDNIKIKSKFMRSQLFYDLSFYEQSINYFKLLLNEEKSDEFRKKSLFMIAYIYNNNLDMYTDALDYYKQFLAEYEGDDLIPSVKFEIEQINEILLRIKE